jgi:hypothetical protein
MKHMLGLLAVLFIALSACSSEPVAQVRTPGVLFFYTDG